MHKSCLAAALLCFAALMPGQVRAVSIETLKLSYIYNFVKYVRWPGEALGSNQNYYTVCIAWDEVYEKAKNLLESGSVGGRSIVVRDAKQLSDLNECHVLYMREQDKTGRRLLNRLPSLSDRPVLTISDQENFIDRGGIVGFILQGDKLKFEINLKQAKAVNLYINSRVLVLALKVVK